MTLTAQDRLRSCPHRGGRRFHLLLCVQAVSAALARGTSSAAPMAWIALRVLQIPDEQWAQWQVLPERAQREAAAVVEPMGPAPA